MEDVIFAGTQSRKKVGFAEVSIYFDNSDASLPVEFSEVVVGRKVYRTGESGYYINGSECRLKDVQELFMDTGVGKDGYSIIGQGKIDEILSNKSEERRAIFEEASGIVKYRTRKDEATKKLENTNNDLLRVADVLKEIENIIDSLEKKSEVAKKYLILKDELKKAEVKIFLKNIQETAENLAKLDSVLETYTQNQTNEEQVALEIEKAKMNLKERLDQVTLEIEETQAKYYEMENESEKTNSKVDILNEKIANSKFNIDRLNKEILQDKENIELLEAEVIKKEEKKESLDKDKVKFETDLKDKEAALSQIVQNLDAKEMEIEGFKKEVEELNNQKSEVKIEISSLSATILSNEKQLENMVKDEEKKVSQKDSLVIEKDDIYSKLVGQKNKLISIETIIEGYNKRMFDASSENQKMQSNKDALNQELMTAKSKFNYLNNLEHENEGYYKSVKSVLDYAKDNNMSKVYGTVASVISTSEKYEYALEIALGGYLQNVIVETDSEAKNLIEYLKESSYGRATFLPLSSIKKVDSESGNKYKGYTGFLGMATELVKYDKKYQHVVELALNRTAIVDTIDNATEMAKKTKNSIKIVTLSGELISQVGSITGGKNQIKSSGLIGRNEKIANLKLLIEQKSEEFEKIKQKENELAAIINEIESKYDEEKLRYDDLKIEVAKLDENYKNIEKELLKVEENKKSAVINKENILKENEELNKKIAEYNADILVIESKLEQKQNVITEYTRFNKEKEQTIDFLNEDIMNLKISLSSFDESVLAINEMREKIDLDINNFNNATIKKAAQIEEYRKEIDSNKAGIIELLSEIENMKEFKTNYSQILENLKSSKTECVQKQDILEIKMLESIRKIDKIKEEKAKYENKKVRFDIELENMKNAMWNDYELTISSAKQFVETLTDEEKQLDKNIEKKSEDIRKKIKDLGDVDVNSIEEYKTTKERYDFIGSQKNDLEETKKKLENLIQNMTVIMKQQFSTQFEIINENFSNTFKELFGGGKAELKLSDQNNILESGIEIEVQPPGKKLQNMMLLSGGERALTAISLLFAILKIKAPPFCILDEIEAALDDVNVQRFAEYIKNYSKNSQFVVITHRKGTMEVASSVYGVTMQEYGISKIISMKMTNA